MFFKNNAQNFLRRLLSPSNIRSRLSLSFFRTLYLSLHNGVGRGGPCRLVVLVWFFFKFKLKKKTKMGYEKSAPQSFVVPRYPTPRGFTKSGRRKLGPDLFVVSCYASPPC